MNVRELIALSALDDVVENEDGAVVGRFEDENVLVLALLVVEDLLDLEGHGLTRPHAGDLTEPAICGRICQSKLFQDAIIAEGWTVGSWGRSAYP